MLLSTFARDSTNQLILRRCVVNERFISPFRGTYSDNEFKHVTLYSYLKAFRFTGSPVLYLECEVHMCQSACPVSMAFCELSLQVVAVQKVTRQLTK